MLKTPFNIIFCILKISFFFPTCVSLYPWLILYCGVHTVCSVHSCWNNLLLQCSKLCLSDEWSSFLSAVLYVNLLPAAWLLFFFFSLSLFGAELMRYSSGLQHALCASGIGGSGGKKTHKRVERGGRSRSAGDEEKQRESHDSCMTPSFFFAVAAVKWR